MRKTFSRKYWEDENGVTVGSSKKSDPKSRVKKWWGGERGMSSIVVFILGMPALLVAFGYGFDSLRLIYVKESLQGTLNRATQAGVAQTISYTGQRLDSDGNVVDVPMIGLVGNASNHVPPTSNRNTKTAPQIAYQFYAWNTEAMRTKKVLECSTAPGLPATEPTKKSSVGAGMNTEVVCGGKIEYVGKPLTASELCTPLSDPLSARYGLRYTVTETVSAAFLRIVGIQNHYVKDLTSISYVRGRGC